MKRSHYKELIMPLIFTAFFLLFNYFFNQWYAEKYDVQGVDYSYIFYHLNQAIPFISWTVYPYIIAYPFWIISFIYIGYRSNQNLYIISTVSIIAFFICGIWYFFWQSDVEAWRITSGIFANNNYLTPRHDLNFTESIVMWIYQQAGPRNALPSMHTIASWIAIIGVRRDKTMPKVNKFLIVSIAISIIIATQTLKQHYIIDVIVGIAIAESIYWMIYQFKIYHFFELFFNHLNQITKLHKK